MRKTFKIGHQAFSRGVDEVMLLKPVRRVVHAVISGEKVTTRGSQSRKLTRVTEMHDGKAAS